MNEQEINALVQLLNRAPMTQAELLWLTELLGRLRAQLPKPPAQAPQPPAEAGT